MREWAKVGEVVREQPEDQAEIETVLEDESQSVLDWFDSNEFAALCSQECAA